MSPHLLQKRSDFGGVTSNRNHRINAALWTHRCLSLASVVIIHPLINSLRRVNLTAVKAPTKFRGKELAAVNAASLVRGYMILGMCAISGVHFLENVERTHR